MNKTKYFKVFIDKFQDLINLNKITNVTTF